MFLSKGVLFLFIRFLFCIYSIYFLSFLFHHLIFIFLFQCLLVLFTIYSTLMSNCMCCHFSSEGLQFLTLVFSFCFLIQFAKTLLICSCFSFNLIKSRFSSCSHKFCWLHPLKQKRNSPNHCRHHCCYTCSI